jgi:hypothetical protein
MCGDQLRNVRHRTAELLLPDEKVAEGHLQPSVHVSCSDSPCSTCAPVSV